MDSVKVDVEEWNGKFVVSTDDDEDGTCDTLAEAYLFAAKRLIELANDFYNQGLNELQERINKL